MCGIAGEVSFAAPPDEARVLRMTNALAHRGPDGSGLVRAGAACFGHRRLALLDREGGAQPMSRDRRHLVFNGEIDNAKALRARYEDRWSFRTRSDTEVLLAALVLDGEAAIPTLDGMFAFFFWDEDAQRGLAARDRLGVRPFVYTRAHDRFAFASEAKALVREVGARADLEAIAEVLCAAPFSGVKRSPFAGVEILQPGHLLRVGRDGADDHAWFVPRLTADRDDDALVGEIRDRLDDAVQGALIADASIGLFLSGGLDSTLLAALAHRPLRAYTVGFDDQDAFAWSSSRIVVADDEPYAALAADALGLQRTRCVRPRASLATAIAKVAVTDDRLPAWEQELSQDLLCEHAARDVKAVIVGDAADELHYGYHFLLDEEALSGPEAIIPRFGVAPLHRDLFEPVSHFAKQYRDEAERVGLGWGSLDERRLATTWLVVTRWLPRLLSNGDLHAMAHGLEARVPFAHPALVDVALSVSPRRALRNGVEKSLLREVARGLVPEAIRARRKSALPKDLAAEPVYRAELAKARDRAASLFDAVLDREGLAALRAKPTWTEAERAIAFRLIALSHWAARYEVRA